MTALTWFVWFIYLFDFICLFLELEPFIWVQRRLPHLSTHIFVYSILYISLWSAYDTVDSFPSFSLYSTKSTECEINVSHIEHASAATHTAHISDSLEFNWIVLANWIWSVLPFETTENKCIKIEMICRWGWRDSRLVKVFIGRVKRAQAKH